MNEKKPTTRRPITLADIEAIDYIDGYKKIEVVDGDWHKPDVLFYRSHGALAGITATNILRQFFQQLEPLNLGHIYAGSVGYVMEGRRDNIHLMRRTDISFVKNEHLTDEHDEPYYRAPDLAVEILHEDLADDLFERIHDYLSHGTEQVWVIVPSLKQILVSLPDGTSKTYYPGDTLPGGALLPGFTLEVEAVFKH